MEQWSVPPIFSGCLAIVCQCHSAATCESALTMLALPSPETQAQGMSSRRRPRGAVLCRGQPAQLKAESGSQFASEEALLTHMFREVF